MERYIILIICSGLYIISGTQSQSEGPPEGIPSPNFKGVRNLSLINFQEKYSCGFRKPYGTFFNGGIEGQNYPIYFLNYTANILKEKGFEITINEVVDDILWNITYSNATFTNSLAYDSYSGIAPVGGEPAPITRSYYMAQLGRRQNDITTWLCDGVLINLQWVLTAAHCFLSSSPPNIVRLGDYELSDLTDPSVSLNISVIKDYPIVDIIPHPEFNLEERYHDLVLLRLPYEKPIYAPNIHPICLPWGEETNRNLVGTKVALSGWGATRYGGPKTTLLQEVYLKIYNTSVCAQAYEGLRGIKRKFPNGITDDTNLCVGWDEDGRDACGGDSGGPIVYEKGEKYILAGIVSTGQACGQKEYPGLYVPINKPKYLQWIKDVAFKNYE